MRNAINPRREFSLRIKILNTLICLGKNILDNIFRFNPITNQTHNIEQKFSMIPIKKFVVNLAVLGFYDDNQLAIAEILASLHIGTSSVQRTSAGRFFCTLSFFMETADKNDVFGKSVLRLDGKTGTDS